MALCFFNGLRAQIINFPDANFKKMLLLSSTNIAMAVDSNGNNMKIDANNNNEIEVNEVGMVYRLNLAMGANYPYPVSNFIGINNFISLRKLGCTSNKATTLDLRNLIFLEELECSYSTLTSLNVEGLNKLITLDCKSSRLASLNVKGCTSLSSLICYDNKLSSLDISDSINITQLICYDNSLQTLKLGALSKLTYLNFNSNKLTTIDLSGLISLNTIYCSDNLFKIIDISNLPALNDFICNSNNLLTAILMQNNGLSDDDMYYNSNINSNPNLKYICVEEARQYYVYDSLLYKFGIKGVEINSYCSFVPSNPYYVIQGDNRFDSNNNGCDGLDSTFPFFKLKILNNNVTREYLSSNNGNYYVPVASGINTVTPVIENSAYFNVFPTTVSVTFSAHASPFTQNFCVTAKGIHPDLEVTLLPLSVARPGFDSKYKIVYKNKGNQTQSGSVNLTFDDATLDFISANPVATTQKVNSLSWNFTNLKPFESKEIIFTMNVNSPMETPAVKNGDILKFAATITSQVTDETPIDNAFTLNQTVVGSYDPNDKTCLEGNKIKPELIGQYVHYMIRFENTGTYAAQNIVVKDMIDLSKFDISTLVPTSSSHSFVTKISDKNRVEFIFENINLPFDDANNDGYVAFKIKTLPTLKVGDSFTNEANIYFDYNFPILTNKATSKFETTLNIQDFDFSNYFSLYPNPVNEELNIIAKQNIELQSLTIYDILGQVVIAFPNAKSGSKIDVSKLSSGNYFVKVKSDKGISSMKFIKN